MKHQFINRLESLNLAEFSLLSNEHNPLISFDFLSALERSKSVSGETGWQANHLAFYDNDEKLTGVLPTYIKSHSWGEYVFDWSWADAYQRYGLEYYPKLVSTIPFTPVPSEKLLSQAIKLQDTFEPLTRACIENNYHSWHVLFVPEIACPEVTVDLQKSTPFGEDVFVRNTVQFHWFNRGYQSFEQYLSSFTARKRKNTKKERASIIKQGIEVEIVRGEEVTHDLIEFFYLTYQLTYMKKGHQPHLSFAFFEQIFEAMPQHLLLVVAKKLDNKDEEKVACSLFIYDENNLYGRYWGCTEYINNLHFELCYYQGIEFCIENNIQCFNPGTQGEHKIQRGFEPVLTYSYHWIKEEKFRPAIADFCQQEREHMQKYLQQCKQALPFKLGSVDHIEK